MGRKTLMCLVILIITKHKVTSKFAGISKCHRGPVDRKFNDYTTNGYAFYCNNTNQTEIPRFDNDSYPHLYQLDLSRNNISKLNNYSFIKLSDLRILQLSQNHINTIDGGAFVGLDNLLYLTLDCNNLSNSSTSLRPGVFQPLKKLSCLHLKQNKFQDFNGLENELHSIKTLTNLYLEGCEKCHFGPGFAKMTNLSSLSLSTADSSVCWRKDHQSKCKMPYSGNLNNETFINLKLLKELSLSDCDIKKIEPDTFKELLYLQKLDISYNDIKFKGMMNATHGIQNNTRFISLKATMLHGNRASSGRGTVLKKQHTQYLPRSLKTLHIDLNKIEILEVGVLTNLPYALTKITASGNRFTADKYLKDFLKMNITLKYVDISRQHLFYDPFRRQNNNPPDQLQTAVNTMDANTVVCNKGDVMCFVVPAYVEKVKWRKSVIEGSLKTTVVWAPSLKEVDLSFNILHTWIGPVYGVGNIEYLSLAENYCQNVSHFFFQNFWNLTVLNVSTNLLGYAINERITKSGLTFRSQTKLKRLYLSSNRISSLPKNIFSNLESIEVIDISWNSLTTLSGVEIKHLKCLQYLNLADNNFLMLQTDVTNSLNIILAHLRSINETLNLTVSLKSNPMSCLCANRHFIGWVVHSKVGVEFSKKDQCHLPSTAAIFFSKPTEIINTLDIECRSHTVALVIGASVFTCLGSSLLCLVIYKNRWKLRHAYYSKKRRHNHKGYERIFDNDAFISYAGSEGRFIKQTLVPVLEGVHGLKLWVADRDSKVGVSIAENITHAIYNSKKAVVILSQKYLKESWCDYELNMARMEAIDSKRRMIIFILYEDIPAKHLPLDVIRLIDTEHSIDYPDSPQHSELFWTKVADLIMKE